MISTRRFSARPASVLLLAIGFVLPQPFTLMRAASMPCQTR